ncbi:MAG TPA: hypothetical protein VND64_17300 [Pirellulales bacterium]|nr:hypothetical protein [Pirellulales bacterium]
MSLTTVRFPRVVSGHDIGVLEPGGRLHFAPETLHGLRRAGPGRRWQELQGHDALHPPVQGLVDLPHASFANFGEDHVLVKH